MNPVVPPPVEVKLKVLEKHVEKSLYNKMKALGGECYKWSSQNQRGVPDRICVFPNGRVVFVELKRDRKAKLSPGQAKFFTRMAQLGMSDCVVLYGKEDVRQFIADMGY